MNNPMTDKIDFQARINEYAVDAADRIAEAYGWLYKMQNEHERGSDRWLEIDEQITNLIVARDQVGSICFLSSEFPRISHEEANARHKRFVQSLRDQGFCEGREIKYYGVYEDVMLPDGSRLLISEISDPYRTREEALKKLNTLLTRHPTARVGYSEFYQ